MDKCTQCGNNLGAYRYSQRVFLGKHNLIKKGELLCGSCTRDRRKDTTIQIVKHISNNN